MTVPTIFAHTRDTSFNDATSISFTNPANLQVGDLIIDIIGAWDDATGNPLTADEDFSVVDTAQDDSAKADALIMSRVVASTAESGATVTVDVTPATVTAIVHTLVIRNWWGSVETGVATVPHTYAEIGTGASTFPSPPITSSWPQTDDHIVIVWAVVGRAGDAFTQTPAGYTVISDGIINVSNSNRGIAVASGYKTLSGTTETPGNWETGNNLKARYAGTILVRGISTGPSVTVTGGALTPSTAFSGSYMNYAGVPTSPATLSDGTVTRNLTVSISDNGDGSGTFSGTTPARPPAGSTDTNWPQWGEDLTFTLTDPGA